MNARNDNRHGIFGNGSIRTCPSLFEKRSLPADASATAERDFPDTYQHLHLHVSGV